MDITAVLNNVLNRINSGTVTETVRRENEGLHFLLDSTILPFHVVVLMLTACRFCECNNSKLWLVITEVKPSYLWLKSTSLAVSV